MNLSEHFTLEEACFSSTAQRLGLENSPTSTIVEAMRVAASGMEQVRRVLGNFPLHIDSWYRCPELNTAVHGATFSAHIMGWAVDFLCPQAGHPSDICITLQAHRELVFDQLIQEGTWVHISFSPTNRRQVLTAHFGPNGTTYS